MITDISLDLDAFRSDLAYCITSDAEPTCHISATKRWSKIIQHLGEDFFITMLSAVLSHEEMHFIITKIESDPASTGLDNLEFQEGELWELARF